MSVRRRHAHVYLILLSAAALVAVALVLCAFGLSHAVAGGRGRHHCGRIWRAPRKATNHQLRTSTLCLVNRARERRGIGRLSFSINLRRSATALSRTMVGDGIFSHYGPHGSTPLRRIAHTGYLAGASSYRVAENIAVGRGRSFGSPAAIVRQWMHSPMHRANILDGSLRDFGVGVARGNPYGGGRRDTATYTLDFGARRR
jgi:uncharacterized protein YkwD